MDIVYFLKALLKKKWWIIISTILAVVAAFVFTMGRPRLYVSNAQMSTGFTINDQVKLRDENISLYEADVKFDNVVQIMTSPTVISLLSYQLLIHDLTGKPFTVLTEKEINTPQYKSFNRQEGLQVCRNKLDSLQMLSSYQPDERKLQEYLKLYRYDYESIRKMLSVGRLQRTDYIEIVYRSSNPELSAFVVNTLYQEFIRYYRSMRSERSVENIESFEELVNQKKRELDQKVEALRQYKSSEGLLNVEAASGSQMGLISQLEKALLDENANKNTIYASLQSVNKQLDRAKAGKPVYTTGNSEIVTLRKQINDLNDEYLRKGSNDEALANRIKNLRSQLQKALANASVPAAETTDREELEQRKSTLEAEMSASLLNIASLESKIRNLKGSIGTYANKEATVSTLQQEVTLAQEEYNKLKEKLNTAQDSRRVQPDNFRQTLMGQPAFRPESSKRMIIMGMAGISVFMLSSLCILLLEFFDSSIKSPSIFERTVDLKLISTINRADLHRHSILEILQRTSENGNGKVFRKRKNTFRELLRKLRYEIENSGKSVFLFTSTERQQGKTTLVQAVAYSLSLSNKRVLIIDTNFCNNDLTVQLEAKPTLESFSIRPEDFSIDKVREMAATTYAVSGVEVVGCKGGDYTPSEVLPEHNLLDYLPQLTGYYDFVLLEGAPLNDYTDSKELVNYAEGVVAIFSSTISLKQNDKESIQFLQGLNGKFLGAVLNKVNDDHLEL